MSKKRHSPVHTQILGIIWLSAALLIIAGMVFFSSRRAPKEAEPTASIRTERELLEQKEDSVYRSRRPTQRKQQSYNKIDNIKQSLYTTVPPTRTKQPLEVELNGADTLTLQLLHGIGPAFARRIVRYRERLGGFHSCDQLLEVYGFTPELLAHIRPHLTLDSTAIQRIDLNTVGLKELARHPYIEYYQARDIVRLRSLGTRFHSADDLRAIPSMADSTLQRLLPYLEF